MRWCARTSTRAPATSRWTGSCRSSGASPTSTTADVSSPLNMGYFCIDADAASIAAMDETNRRGANVAVRGQHPASAAFEQYGVDRIMEAFGIDPVSGRRRPLHGLRHRGEPYRHDRRLDRPALASQSALPRLRSNALHRRVTGRRRALRILAARLAAAERAACALRLAPDSRLDREERAQPGRHRVDPHRAGRQRPSHGRWRARRHDDGRRGLGRLPALPRHRLGRRDAVGHRRSRLPRSAPCAASMARGFTSMRRGAPSQRSRHACARPASMDSTPQTR